MNSDDRTSPIDDDYIGNLDALTRDLDDIEKLAAAALSDSPGDLAVRERIASTPGELTYAGLTDHHRDRRAAEGWEPVEMADLLDPIALAQLDAWRAAQRIPWNHGDLIIVGIAGLMGALGNLFDEKVDAAVLGGLALLKKTKLLADWEKDTARLPIDHSGPKFGGPTHRVRSAGHDVGRFFTALAQVRTGTFEGTSWDNGQRVVIRATTTPSGQPFKQNSEWEVALALLLKHWAADFVTKMSLPMPGWTLLYEMPSKAVRTFAHDAYSGANYGQGLNLRSGILTPGLGMLATELIIRTHSHLDAYCIDDTVRLMSSRTAKHAELMLAAHSAAGAISLSKTAAAAVSGESALAVRHLNIPVLLRIGKLALQVRADTAARASAEAPSWEQLLATEATSWTLPEAITLADLLEDSRAENEYPAPSVGGSGTVVGEPISLLKQPGVRSRNRFS
ncbi:hypothetical protein ACWIGI_26875 [Nocardia sp. NPDC055321]